MRRSSIISLPGNPRQQGCGGEGVLQLRGGGARKRPVHLDSLRAWPGKELCRAGSIHHAEVGIMQKYLFERCVQFFSEITRMYNFFPGTPSGLTTKPTLCSFGLVVKPLDLKIFQQEVRNYAGPNYNDLFRSILHCVCVDCY